jgi:steroid delta-isomerase-like uncharacterized protein
MADHAADLARRFFEEVWNNRRGESIEEFAHHDGISHRTDGVVIGRDDFLNVVYRPLVKAVPDLRIAVEDVLGRGDQAVVRWFLTGTHTGDGLGIPPSGRSIRLRGMTWLVFRDGKIAEGWDCWDLGGLLASLREAG